MSNTIIIDSQPHEPITVTRQGHYLVAHQNGEQRVIHTAAHVTISPATVPNVGFQTQIDNINQQLTELPTWETTNWA